jgi:hypothetical protein
MFLAQGLDGANQIDRLKEIRLAAHDTTLSFRGARSASPESILPIAHAA